MAINNLLLVYGGGISGMMGAVADGCLESGGDAVAIIPKEVQDHERPHPKSKIRSVGTIEMRKKAMLDLGDALVVLPGGLGTLDEMFFVLSRLRMGLHNKPCGLLNTCGYFDGLRRFFDHAVEKGFIKPKHLASLSVFDDPADLVLCLKSSIRWACARSE